MAKRVGPTTGKRLATRLQTLRLRRRRRRRNRNGRRKTLTPLQRQTILKKTSRRCHVCGGHIGRNNPWQADHVLAHSRGGRHAADNYLPADAVCSNYRWDYLSEEFQYILKLGGWAVNHIRRDTAIGREIAERFVRKEEQRRNRVHARNR